MNPLLILKLVLLWSPVAVIVLVAAAAMRNFVKDILDAPPSFFGWLAEQLFGVSGRILLAIPRTAFLAQQAKPLFYNLLGLLLAAADFVLAYQGFQALTSPDSTLPGAGAGGSTDLANKLAVLGYVLVGTCFAGVYFDGGGESKDPPWSDVSEDDRHRLRRWAFPLLIASLVMGLAFGIVRVLSLEDSAGPAPEIVFFVLLFVLLLTGALLSVYLGMRGFISYWGGLVGAFSLIPSVFGALFAVTAELLSLITGIVQDAYDGFALGVGNPIASAIGRRVGLGSLPEPKDESNRNRREPSSEEEPLMPSFGVIGVNSFGAERAVDIIADSFWGSVDLSRQNQLLPKKFVRGCWIINPTVTEIDRTSGRAARERAQILIDGMVRHGHDALVARRVVKGTLVVLHDDADLISTSLDYLHSVQPDLHIVSYQPDSPDQHATGCFWDGYLQVGRICSSLHEEPVASPLAKVQGRHVQIAAQANLISQLRRSVIDYDKNPSQDEVYERLGRQGCLTTSHSLQELARGDMPLLAKITGRGSYGNYGNILNRAQAGTDDALKNAATRTFDAVPDLDRDFALVFVIPLTRQDRRFQRFVRDMQPWLESRFGKRLYVFTSGSGVALDDSSIRQCLQVSAIYPIV